MARLKNLLIKFKDWFVEEKKLLPVGITEFHVWADNIIEKTGKFADEDSLKWAISNMILHADSDVSALADSYFMKRLRKAAANQIASQVFMDIKLKQEAAQKVAQVETGSAQPIKEENEGPKKTGL